MTKLFGTVWRSLKRVFLFLFHSLGRGYRPHVLFLLVGTLLWVNSQLHRQSPGRHFVSDAGHQARDSCKDCKTIIPQCRLTPVIKERYKTLRGSSRFLFAMALYNSEAILRNMGAQLEEILEFLGPEFTFLSVYEGGSTDSTETLLSELAGRLEVKGIVTHVMTGGKKIEWDRVHRIGALADVRNMVLKRLFEDVHRVDSKHTFPKYETLVYLNDIVFCAADVLELIYQHQRQGAHMTCPLDFGAWNRYKRPYYDLWVGRTMAGDIMYDAFSGGADGAEDPAKKISHEQRRKIRDAHWATRLDQEPFWKDPKGQLRARQGLSVQVYSCWNGGAVIDTRPFYEDGLKFRRGFPPRECSESECSHFCKDLWNLGYGKIQVVPTVGVAYSMEDFFQVRTAWESLPSPTSRMTPMYYLKSVNWTLAEEKEYPPEPEPIQWAPIPQKVVCYSLNKIGERGADWTVYEWIDPTDAPLPRTFPLPFS